MAMGKRNEFYHTNSLGTYFVHRYMIRTYTLLLLLLLMMMVVVVMSDDDGDVADDYVQDYIILEHLNDMSPIIVSIMTTIQSFFDKRLWRV